MQELSLKKLDHDIFKSQEDSKTNLRKTVAEKVVRDAPCAPPALLCLVLFLLLTNDRFVPQTAAKELFDMEDDTVEKADALLAYIVRH
jgi:hypothetical protein